MATFIGSAIGTTTATLPSHQAGDFIVAWAYRDGSTTAPALASGQGWTSAFNGGIQSNSGRCAVKVAASSSEGVGTFTNATTVIVAVWRPGSGETLSAGVFGQTGGTTDPQAWPALTGMASGGTSWAIGMSGHRMGDTTLETPFTGMVNRVVSSNPLWESVLHDTDGGVSSWSSGSQNVGGTQSGYRTGVLEMIVTGGGGPTRTPRSYAMFID